MGQAKDFAALDILKPLEEYILKPCLAKTFFTGQDVCFILGSSFQINQQIANNSIGNACYAGYYITGFALSLPLKQRLGTTQKWLNVSTSDTIWNAVLVLTLTAKHFVCDRISPPEIR